MLKRALSCTLSIVIVLVCAVFSVPQKEDSSFMPKNHLTKIPDYSLKEGADTDEIRSTAVRAMRDALTVPWFVKDEIRYVKTGPAEGKVFRFKEGDIYCGLPYTNSNTGLLHWLQFYDFKTGEFTPENPGDINRTLGNACAVGLMWGWSAVSTSINWHFCQEMVPKNGVFPVGDYKYDLNTSDLTELGTDNICTENGRDAMFAAYAAVKPGDALVYCPTVNVGNHVVMAVEKPSVKYNPDGSIDGKKSIIYFQDQSIGNFNYSAVFNVYEDGEHHHYSGNRHTPRSFESFYKEGFMPVTCAEFTGDKPYEKAYVKANAKTLPDTYSALSKITLSSNYNIVSVKFTVTDTNGKAVAAYNYVSNADELSYSQKPLNFPLKQSMLRRAITEKLESKKKYKIKAQVLVATGETFTPIDTTVIYE